MVPVYSCQFQKLKNASFSLVTQIAEEVVKEEDLFKYQRHRWL
jgi:hypothetical protein